MRKKLLILVTLFLLVLTCTASANFVQLNRTSVGARLRDVRYITTFNDYGSKFRFSFRSQGHKPGVLTVKKDNKVIYSDKVPFAGYAYMNRIQDEDSGRIFYILGNTELFWSSIFVTVQPTFLRMTSSFIRSSIIII
jgi:hypothetical protein